MGVALGWWFGADHMILMTMAPKSVTSPIAMLVAEQIGGVAAVVLHRPGMALGGAGLIYTEMLAPSADARITPGCAGLWNDAQAAAWQRIVAFVHGHSGAKMGVQLGHAGRTKAAVVKLLTGKVNQQCFIGEHLALAVVQIQHALQLFFKAAQYTGKTLAIKLLVEFAHVDDFQAQTHRHLFGRFRLGFGDILNGGHFFYHSSDDFTGAGQFFFQV